MREGEHLVVWTIYAHPTDYPEHFVARPHYIEPGHSVPGPDVLLANTLDQIRELIPPGLYCLHRQPEDDPKIVESWI